MKCCGKIMQDKCGLFTSFASYLCWTDVLFVFKQVFHGAQALWWQNIHPVPAREYVPCMCMGAPTTQSGAYLLY